MNEAQEKVKEKIKYFDAHISLYRRTRGIVTVGEHKSWDETTCEEQTNIDLNTDEAYCGYKDLTDQESKDWMFLMAYAHVVLKRAVDLKNREPERIKLKVDIDGNVFDEDIKTLNEIETDCFQHTLPF